MSILDTLRGYRDKAMSLLNSPVNGAGGFLKTVPKELEPVLALTAAQLASQERTIVARAFADGFQGVKLTPRLQQFLGPDSGQFQLRINMCRKTVKAISERLVVDGFDSTSADEIEKAKQIAFAQMVWDTSRMKGKRAALFADATRDGNGYLLVEFDNEANRPRLWPHLAYTDSTTTCEGHSGNGEGIWFKYPNDDTDRKPVFAVKRWTEVNDSKDESNPRGQRINVYFADHIDKWVLADNGWTRFAQLPWVDMGIAAVHLRSPDERPAFFEAIPLQKSLNKTFTDLIASSDASAFRIIIALGWNPKDSDDRWLTIDPGRFIGNEDATQGSVVVVDPVPLDSAIAVVDKMIATMADVVDVPLSLLNRSNQRAAEGTLQEEKESFAAKVRDYQESYEMALEDAFKLARRQWNEFAIITPELEKQLGFGKLDENCEFRVKWAAFSSRSVGDMAAEASALMAAKVPADVIQQRVWGFTPQQTEQWKNDAFNEPEIP